MHDHLSTPNPSPLFPQQVQPPSFQREIGLRIQRKQPGPSNGHQPTLSPAEQGGWPPEAEHTVPKEARAGLGDLLDLEKQTAILPPLIQRPRGEAPALARVVLQMRAGSCGPSQGLYYISIGHVIHAQVQVVYSLSRQYAGPSQEEL